MILFHAISTYQLLSMIVYKLVFHKEDKATLIIADSLRDKFPQYESLLTFFDEIYVYQIQAPMLPGKGMVKSASIYFEQFFRAQGHSIDEFDKIYVACAHYFFGIYLASQGIEFTFFEDAAGILTQPEVLENIEKDKYPTKQKYVKEYGLYDGSGASINKIVCNFNSQCKEFNRDKAQHFDLVKEYLDLTFEEQTQIKEFFLDFDKIDIPANATLMLTQHLANLKILSFEDHILIYQTVIDYFFEKETIVWKPHPDDLMYYSILFEGDKVIREKFPSEFLPTIFNEKPKKIATISSTAINNLYNYFDEAFCLNTSYEKDFYWTHRYYIANRIINLLSEKKSSIKSIGTNEILLEKLLQTPEFIHKKLKVVSIDSHEQIKNDKDSNNVDIYIVDKIENCNSLSNDDIIGIMEDLSENGVIIFINSAQDFCFYNINNKYLWNNILPICIQKKQIRTEEFYANTEEEIIYVYSKNARLLQMIEEMKVNKKLEKVGLELNLSNLTKDQKRIKVLEGILEATEKRLLHYINLVEENKKQEESK